MSSVTAAPKTKREADTGTMCEAPVGWLTSEDVNLDQLDSMGLAKQAQNRFQAREHDDGLLVFEADGTLVTEDYVTRKRRRVQEEAEAVGGLRNPASSLKHLRQAEAGSAPIRMMIDTVIHKRRKELTQAMNALGQVETPSVCGRQQKRYATRCASTMGCQSVTVCRVP